MPAPFVIFGELHDLGSNRIQCVITDDFQEVLLFFNEPRVKPTLKEMSCSLVTSIEGLRIAAVQPLHSPRERAVGQFKHEMVMVRHQHVLVDNPLETVGGVAKQVQENEPVL